MHTKGTRSIATMLAFLFASFVAGCYAMVVESKREDRIDALNQVLVIKSQAAPTQDELSRELGSGSMLVMADLKLLAVPVTLAQHEVLYDAMKAELQEQAKVPRREKKEENGEQNIAKLPAYALLGVMGIIAAPAMIADLPVSAAVLAAHPDETEAKVGSRLALFAYGPDKAYRWHACCLPRNVIDAQGLRARSLPLWMAGISPTPSGPEFPPTYLEDRIALICSRATAGSKKDQIAMWNAYYPDLAGTAPLYFWARVLSEGPDARPEYLEKIEKKFGAAALREGAREFPDEPLGLLDCRSVARELAAAKYVY